MSVDPEDAESVKNAHLARLAEDEERGYSDFALWAARAFVHVQPSEADGWSTVEVMGLPEGAEYLCCSAEEIEAVVIGVARLVYRGMQLSALGREPLPDEALDHSRCKHCLRVVDRRCDECLGCGACCPGEENHE